MNKKLVGSLTVLALLTGAVSAHEVKADVIVSGNTYKITARHSGKVLDVARGAKNAGANVQQWSDTNGTNQKWEFTKVNDGENTNPSDTTPTTTTGFHTSGTTLYDAKGNPFIMRGINYPYAWYKGQEDTAIPAIARTGTNCIRIVMGDGQQYSKTSLAEIQELLRLCKDNHLIAIVEAHDATGSDNIQDLENAANYWIEMKNVLIGNEANVILNIANEWAGSWDSSTWASGYQQVIPKLRNAGIKNTIMVDCAGWGQYPKSITDAGQSVLQSDSQKNIMFSIHMYEYAGAYGAVQNNIDSSLAVGAPLCIGEFGIKHTNGPIDYKTIMSYSQAKGVGYLGWSWKGNSSELAYLDMVQDWAGTQLTEQGNAILNDQNGIKNTSKYCSIFD